MGKGAKMKATSKKTFKEESYESDDDSESETTNVVVLDGDEVDAKKVEPEFDVSDVVERMGEKRSLIREKAMEEFLRFLRSSSPVPFKTAIASHEETLHTLLIRIVKRPVSVKEGKLCLELVTLLSLVQGANEVDFFELYEKPLTQLVVGGTMEELREYALFTLTFMSFVNSNVDSNEDIWILCEQIMTDSAEALPYTIGLKAVAAQCWLLIATIMDEQSVLEHSCEIVFEALQELMDQSNTVPGIGTLSGQSGVDIKVLAGRGFAFLWEVSDSVLSTGDAKKASNLICHSPHTVDEVLAQIKHISKESSKSISKKDRKEQRSEFREIDDYIFNGELMREVTVKFQGAEYIVDSFKTAILMDAFRKVTGSALPSALKMFPVVREILEIEHLSADMEENWRDKEKKVGKSSSADKRRTNYRNQERSYREIGTEGGFYGNSDDV